MIVQGPNCLMPFIAKVEGSIVQNCRSVLYFFKGNRYILKIRDCIPTNFHFGGEKQFLTDARMDPGTSGAPILVEPSQVQHPWGEPVRQFHGAPVLLGIHAGNFPYSDRNLESEEGTESGEVNLRDTFYSDLNETWRPKATTRAIQEADSS